MKIFTLHPNHIDTYGIGYAAFSLAAAMRKNGVDSRILCVTHDPKVNEEFVVQRYSRWKQKFIYKIYSQDELQRKTEALYLEQLEPDDIAYLWPGCTIALYEAIKNKGNIIVTEMINCHVRSAKKIIELESEISGLIASERYSLASLFYQDKILNLSSLIISPSISVTQSLLENGVDAEKIIQSSFGLDKSQQVEHFSETEVSDRTFKAIFVGRVGVRKGIHLLLDYWSRSKVQGELVIYGVIEDGVKQLVNQFRGVNGVKFAGFDSNLFEQMRNADLFIFPSLEEGSPLVLYSALGAGLPCLVSPMGGGGIVKHGTQGYVLEPHDGLGWIEALRALQTNFELRKDFGTSARQLSDEYLWHKVAARQIEELKLKLPTVRGS